MTVRDVSSAVWCLADVHPVVTSCNAQDVCDVWWAKGPVIPKLLIPYCHISSEPNIYPNNTVQIQKYTVSGQINVKEEATKTELKYMDVSKNRGILPPKMDGL